MSEYLGMDTRLLNKAKEVLDDYVAAKATPGAVGLVVRREGAVAKWAIGGHTYEESARHVRLHDLFDLASVTKVVATTTICMVLHSEGKLDLDAPVIEKVPEFSGKGKDLVTARTLLSHCSGLPAHAHLYQTCRTREELLEAVCILELESEPGSREAYSDMGFLVLGMLLEKVGGNRLDRLYQRLVKEPMGLVGTQFCPDESLLARIPPTEYDSQWRRRLVRGEVHDENAACMGGVASHAGLFGPAEDMGRFLQFWLDGGKLEGDQIYPEEAIAPFVQRSNLVAGSTRALGWDTVSSVESTAGSHFSEASFGSLGFTGTSVWADPVRNLGVVLLTNRVHPTRENQGIRKLRPAFHDAVSAALIDQ